MIPTVNGKSFLDCAEEDLKQILEEPDFRENEYLDYKEDFSILSISNEKKKEKQLAIAEFRSDVCAFANAHGGYLIYGIREDGKGIPLEIRGISIANDDTDEFDLRIKNWLRVINPRIPNIMTHYIKLGNEKYVVVLFVHHDSFFPYIHLENEKDYRFYKRTGNSNTTVSYSEMRSMFSQSMVIGKEIEIFRSERIDYFYSQADDLNSSFSKFMLLHIIPEKFLDSNFNQPLFVLDRKGTVFDFIFRDFGCPNGSVPMVEGLRFSGYNGIAEGRLLNNGIAEFFYSVSSYLKDNAGRFPHGFFPWDEFWGMIEKAIRNYLKMLSKLFPSETLYIGVSVIGCKKVATDRYGYSDHSGMIDREKLVMNTFPLEVTEEAEKLDYSLKSLKLDYLLSLGVKDEPEISRLLRELG